MRRVFVALFGLCVILGSLTLVPVGPAGAAQDAARGVVFQGLERDPGACHDAFRVVGARSQVACSHGPDAAPTGVDVRHRRAPDFWAAPGALTPGVGTAAATGGLQCYGTGSDGYRVKAIYAHASTDHFAQYQASFLAESQQLASAGSVRLGRYQPALPTRARWSRGSSPRCGRWRSAGHRSTT